MKILQLRLLGTPQILIDNQPLTGFATNKAKALLFYLAVTAHTDMAQPQPHTRDALAALHALHFLRCQGFGTQTNQLAHSSTNRENKATRTFEFLLEDDHTALVGDQLVEQDDHLPLLLPSLESWVFLKTVNHS